MAESSRQQKTEQLQAGQTQAQQQLAERRHSPSSITTSQLPRNLSTFKKFFVSFVVSLKRIGVLFPIIASFMTLVFFTYVSSLLSSWIGYYWKDAEKGFLIVTAGLLCTLVILLAYAFCSAPFVASINRNTQDSVLFEIRDEELHARLGNPQFEPGLPAISEDDRIERIGIPNLKQDVYKLIAFREAYNSYIRLYERIYSPHWSQLLSSTGDIDAWKLAKQTEEELIDFVAVPIVIREARSDYRAIKASSIDHRDDLLEQLAQAIHTLDPQEEQTSNQGNAANSQPDLKSENDARGIIRNVKQALHTFQKDRLAGVLRLRSHLLQSTLLSGLITYALLIMSIMTIQTPEGAPPAFISALNSVVVIYAIGAVAGLFARLYAEAHEESAMNDYGLSQARLQAIPLISGLAAIGGVLFISTTTFSTINDATALTSIFSLNVRNILVAITFGITPNLLLRNLQKNADQYVSDLKSTRQK